MVAYLHSRIRVRPQSTPSRHVQQHLCLKCDVQACRRKFARKELRRAAVVAALTTGRLPSALDCTDTLLRAHLPAGAVPALNSYRNDCPTDAPRNRGSNAMLSISLGWKSPSRRGFTGVETRCYLAESTREDIFPLLPCLSCSLYVRVLSSARKTVLYRLLYRQSNLCCYLTVK